MKHIIILTLILFLKLTFFITESRGYSYPLIVTVTEITFNYEAGYADDALDIKINNTTDIPKPEYKPASGGRNYPFAYIKSQSNRKIKAKFHHNQGSGVINSIDIFAICEGSQWISSIGITNITFSGGGPTSDLCTLILCYGNIPNRVVKFIFGWQWECLKVNGESIAGGSLYFDYTCHTYYTTLGPPQSPMTEPWTEVLDYACVWAHGKSNETSALKKITDGAYNNLGKSYYGTTTHTDSATFYLTDFFDENLADCRDMSAVVHVFTRAIGGTSTMVRIINGGMYTKVIKLIDDDWGFDYFTFHQVAYKGGVYDACLMLRTDEGVNERVPQGESINGEYKDDLFDHGTWQTNTETFWYCNIY